MLRNVGSGSDGTWWLISVEVRVKGDMGDSQVAGLGYWVDGDNSLVGLIAKMDRILYPSLHHSPLKCDFSAPSSKDWVYFPTPEFGLPLWLALACRMQQRWWVPPQSLGLKRTLPLLLTLGTLLSHHENKSWPACWWQTCDSVTAPPPSQLTASQLPEDAILEPQLSSPTPTPLSADAWKSSAKRIDPRVNLQRQHNT